MVSRMLNSQARLESFAVLAFWYLQPNLWAKQSDHEDKAAWVSSTLKDF